jgi:hypothetical protein
MGREAVADFIEMNSHPGYKERDWVSFVFQGGKGGPVQARGGEDIP